MNTAIIKKTHRPTRAWIHLPNLDRLAIGQVSPSSRSVALAACCVAEGRTGASLSALLAARDAAGWLYGTKPLLWVAESHGNKRVRAAAAAAKKWLADTINERWPGTATEHDLTDRLVPTAVDARFIAPDGPEYSREWHKARNYEWARVDIEVRDIILRETGHPGLRDSTVKAIVDLALA